MSDLVVGGLLFAHYGVDLTEGAELANSFELDRAYLRADAAITEVLAARVTLDAGRESSQTAILPDGSELEVPEDARLRVFVKHAWLEAKAGDVKFRAGMVDTPFIPWEEGIGGLRYTSKVLLDDTRLESSADLGVTALGKHAGGLFTWQAGIFNGEGFANPEIDAGKSFQARVSIDPLAPAKKEGLSLPLGVFVDENVRPGGNSRLTVAGLAGLTSTYLLVLGEVVETSAAGISGLDQSLLLEPRIPEVGYLIARVDHDDPDSATPDDAQLKLWGGVAHDFYERVSVAALWEETLPELPDGSPTQGVYLRMQAGF